MFFKETITFDKFIRYLTTIVICVLAFLLLKHLSNVLIPFFIAWFLAYLLYPIVCFFQYKCKIKNRILSIIVTLLVITALLAGICLLVVPPVLTEIARVKDIVVEYVTDKASTTTIPPFIDNWLKKSISFENIASSLSFSDITAFLEERIPQLLQLISSSLNALMGVVASLISLLYLFFILIDYEKMSEGIIKLFPKNNRTFVSEIRNDVIKGMNSYFRGQSLIAFLVGILFSIGFLIIDFPMAIPLGLFIGLLNLVPYLQTIGLIPTIMLALLKSYDTGDNFWIILLSALAVFAVVQTIQDAILTPKIMGNVTGLNAAVILLSLSIWGALLGFIGLIIALPLTTLMLSYYKRYILRDDSNAEDEKTDSNEQTAAETNEQTAAEPKEKTAEA